MAPYATNVVITSIFPASLPISAMAGVTSPRIINGMMKPRNSLKIPLKVTNTLTSSPGRTFPNPIPNAMAIDRKSVV